MADERDKSNEEDCYFNELGGSGFRKPDPTIYFRLSDRACEAPRILALNIARGLLVDFLLHTRNLLSAPALK